MQFLGIEGNTLHRTARMTTFVQLGDADLGIELADYLTLLQGKELGSAVNPDSEGGRQADATLINTVLTTPQTAFSSAKPQGSCTFSQLVRALMLCIIACVCMYVE